MGQLRIAKMTEATREVEALYSVRPLIMPEHDSRYYAMSMDEMIEQSPTRMLKWVNRWKHGIYHSMRRQQSRAASNTIPIWKMWNPQLQTEPKTIVDRKRSQATYKKELKEKKKLKDMKMTSVFGLKSKRKSTSRAPVEYSEKTYSDQKMDLFIRKNIPECAAFELQVIDSEYGDGWNK